VHIVLFQTWGGYTDYSILLLVWSDGEEGDCVSWFQTFTMFWMLYSFFWVIPRCLNFIFRRFGTLPFLSS